MVIDRISAAFSLLFYFFIFYENLHYNELFKKEDDTVSKKSHSSIVTKE